VIPFLLVQAELLARTETELTARGLAKGALFAPDGRVCIQGAAILALAPADPALGARNLTRAPLAAREAYATLTAALGLAAAALHPDRCGAGNPWQQLLACNNHPATTTADLVAVIARVRARIGSEEEEGGGDA
jgi:hypothetical protein